MLLFYLIKTVIPIVVLFVVIRIVLKVLLNEVKEEKLIKTSIILTGAISILYIFSCGRVEGFEEVANAEVEEQSAEIEDIGEDLEVLVESVMENEDKQDDIIEDGPKPSANSSMITTVGISSQQDEIEGSKDIAVNQPSVEESGEAVAMPTELEKDLPQINKPSDEEIAAKYTILPIDQWMSPNAVDIINATSCSCPTVAPFGGSYLEYN